MKASIIIPTYTFDRVQDVIEVVKLINQDASCNKEIIVVVDRNEELYKNLRKKLESNALVLLSTNPGASSARNLGADMATGEIIVFIDDDITVGHNWLPALMQHYSNPTIVSVGGKIKPLWTSKAQRSFPPELYWIIGCNYSEDINEESDNLREVKSNFAGNMSIKKTCFRSLYFATPCQKIDGKDENAKKSSRLRKYLETDDSEFYIRLNDRFPEFKTLYNPSAVAYHRIYAYRTAASFVLRKAFSEGFSKAYIACQYADIKTKKLSKERSYLRLLFRFWLERRIKDIANRKNVRSNFKSLFLVLTATSTVFLGYAIGIILHSRNKKIAGV